MCVCVCACVRAGVRVCVYSVHKCAWVCMCSEYEMMNTQDMCHPKRLNTRTVQAEDTDIETPHLPHTLPDCIGPLQCRGREDGEGMVSQCTHRLDTVLAL